MPRNGFALMVLLLGALAVTACGCGRQLAFMPVEGTIVKGGRPLRGVEVVFLADSDAGTVGPRATAITDEAGHYRLRTDHGDDGAVAGKHLVLILDQKAAMRRMRGASRGKQKKKIEQLSPEMAARVQEQLKSAEEDSPRVPPSYASISGTPLRVEVQSGAQVIDLEVK
jgi:hypothetical protein